MTFKIFAELIELKAKTASIFPFLLGLGYSLYHYHAVAAGPLVLYFIAMFLFNCFVDTWDNYNDYHKAIDTADYKRNTNIIGREHLSLKGVRLLLGLFFGVSLVLGLVVAAMTGWPVFFLGLICYAVGIFYAGGPKPLSTLPVGEPLSGLTMGFLITLITVYINAHGVFSWNVASILAIFLVSLPNTLLISNLMLANNTCDLEEDESNRRYTVVHYIGRENAVKWWVAAIIVSFLAVIAAVILHLLPMTLLIINLLNILIWPMAQPYLKAQIKRETFIVSVRILLIFQLAQVVLLFLGLIF